MSEWRDLAAEIDTLNFLYLRTLDTTTGWGLRIVVQESLPRLWPENPERDFHSPRASAIRARMKAEPDPTPLAYEITFKEAILYLIQNESYGSYPEAPEVFTGKLFRIFSQSHLLELAHRTTYARKDHPGPETPQHFSIVCQDDVVDVIACMKPDILKIDPE